jgi:hypothetical protein
MPGARLAVHDDSEGSMSALSFQDVKLVSSASKRNASFQLIMAGVFIALSLFQLKDRGMFYPYLSVLLAGVGALSIVRWFVSRRAPLIGALERGEVERVQIQKLPGTESSNLLVFLRGGKHHTLYVGRAADVGPLLDVLRRTAPGVVVG